MGHYDPIPEPTKLERIWSNVWPLTMITLIVFAFCLLQTDWFKEREARRLELNSEGVIIKKRAYPAGTNLYLFYRPDQWYLKVKLNSGAIKEVKVDKDRYMRAKIGDTMTFEQY